MVVVSASSVSSSVCIYVYQSKNVNLQFWKYWILHTLNTAHKNMCVHVCVCVRVCINSAKQFYHSSIFSLGTQYFVYYEKERSLNESFTTQMIKTDNPISLVSNLFCADFVFRVSCLLQNLNSNVCYFCFFVIFSLMELKGKNIKINTTPLHDGNIYMEFCVVEIHGILFLLRVVIFTSMLLLFEPPLRGGSFLITSVSLSCNLPSDSNVPLCH